MNCEEREYIRFTDIKSMTLDQCINVIYDLVDNLEEYPCGCSHTFHAYNKLKSLKDELGEINLRLSEIYKLLMVEGKDTKSKAKDLIARIIDDICEVLI